MKTSEMQGVALDWVVAKAGMEDFWFVAGEFFISGEDDPYHPSTNWAQGGPIIAGEECIATLERLNGGDWRVQAPYDAVQDKPGDYYYGPTPLIAAMRCFVSSKLGDEVEIPEELK